ncbi:SLOG family protein [Chakrabartyella piscis]|uniref:SLOG family protein n=1 Tax=Chakrabartyella piscis TaxID=2918914 RepID=UPI0029584D90|nr:SLOG family protein [Chakrabartyella piscis]
MKIAIIGSRTLTIDNLGDNLGDYLPENVTEIVSGGAKGVDTSAKAYAQANNIPCVEFLPDYKTYKRGAPLKRNLQIIAYADMVLAFWDGKSKGTGFVIKECIAQNIPYQIISIP